MGLTQPPLLLSAHLSGFPSWIMSYSKLISSGLVIKICPLIWFGLGKVLKEVAPFGRTSSLCCATSPSKLQMMVSPRLTPALGLSAGLVTTFLFEIVTSIMMGSTVMLLSAAECGSAARDFVGSKVGWSKHDTSIKQVSIETCR